MQIITIIKMKVKLRMIKDMDRNGADNTDRQKWRDISRSKKYSK